MTKGLYTRYAKYISGGKKMDWHDLLEENTIKELKSMPVGAVIHFYVTSLSWYGFSGGNELKRVNLWVEQTLKDLGFERDGEPVLYSKTPKYYSENGSITGWEYVWKIYYKKVR